MDVDMLCFGGCVSSVDAGFISYESEYSLPDITAGLLKAEL